MSSRISKAVLTITVVTVLGLPAASGARQGADDPAGHVRHGANGVHHRSHHRARHEFRSAERHGRHGADDGPAHR